MGKILIPKGYVEIVKEKEKPTTYIMDKKTKRLKGRIEKGSTRKSGNLYGPFGRTRVIRMRRDYKGLEKGQVIGRTKKIYPKQPNSTLVRTSAGNIKSIRVLRVEKHKRTSKKGRKHTVRKYKRRIRK